MGYSMGSSGTITIPRTQNDLREIVKALHEVGNLEGNVGWLAEGAAEGAAEGGEVGPDTDTDGDEGDTDGDEADDDSGEAIDSVVAAWIAEDAAKDFDSDVDAIGMTLVSNLGTDDASSFGITEGEDGESTVISVWGYGKSGNEEEVLAILAQHGATGTIECVGEDGYMWRYRLEDGKAEHDKARTLYEGDVDTKGWFAQMQATDDSDLDHVAIAPDEAAARALIAQWAREDYAKLASETPGALDVDADDETVIAQWTELLGGVKFSVRQVAASR